MSDMKRMSISLPSELEEAIISLRKTDRFCRSSYAEIIREVLNIGLVKINSTDLDEQHERNTNKSEPGLLENVQNPFA